MINSGTIFRRIGGRIVPIRAGKVAAGTAVTAAGVGSMKNKERDQKRGPNRLLQAGSLGLNVASGIITSMPVSGFKKIFRNQGIGFGLDSVGTALNAASVKDMTGSKKKKIKEFAKAELRSQAVGYSVFGIGLLSNAKVRKKVSEFGLKIIKKVAK
jgi:hypothetical protein